MNPEFLRNVWIELTPRRIAIMVGILGLALFSTVIAGGTGTGLFDTAQWLYYMLVVTWGTWSAARGVVGEIRDRTWDLQRLSSLGAGAMTWGKLFGATIYCWFGGLICLAVMTLYTLAHAGVAQALFDLVYYLGIGVIAQAVSLLASLVAVHRRSSHSRLEVFIYQTVGLIAALAVFLVWNVADPDGMLRGKYSTDTIIWWGVAFGSRAFLLLSLAIFTGWTLVGCYREMRLELKIKNGPWVWLAWLVFIGLYVAGFDAWLSQNSEMTKWDFVALRLALGLSAYLVLTYVMVLLEPKDRVHYRWLAAQFGSGRILSAFANFQAWMMSYAATLIVAVVLIFWVGQHEGNVLQDQMLLVAGLGFVTRDVCIFVLAQTLNGRRRGDFSAIAILFALYVLIPSILGGLGMKPALLLCYPQPSTPVWLGAAIAWGEAVAAVALTATRLVIRRRAQPVLT